MNTDKLQFLVPTLPRYSKPEGHVELCWPEAGPDNATYILARAANAGSHLLSLCNHDTQCNVTVVQTALKTQSTAYFSIINSWLPQNSFLLIVVCIFGPILYWNFTSAHSCCRKKLLSYWTNASSNRTNQDRTHKQYIQCTNYSFIQFTDNPIFDITSIQWQSSVNNSLYKLLLSKKKIHFTNLDPVWNRELGHMQQAQALLNIKVSVLGVQ